MNIDNILNPLPRLTVVGAGPGDPELITLKAIKALEAADVVLYDALLDVSLLNYCSVTCERIFVGKRAGQPSMSQDAINYLIVEKAYTSGHVVRLKGGDPFVFGRGQEEIAFARRFDIPTSYVPGISSAVAVPGVADIPLTARGVSDGFWVLTGTKADGSLSKDLFLAAQSSATVVILMGMSKLAQIAAIYEDAGLGKLPAAIIQGGTIQGQKVAIGMAAELSQLAQQHHLGAPAVIVLGEVVSCNHVVAQLALQWQAEV
jgi:uroporphyrin-III C-methyltransferase